MRSFLIYLILSFTFLLGQGIHDWETISYMNDVKDVQYYEDQIWVVTTGGAYSFNISDSNFQ